MELQPGQIFAEKYRILRLLGQGGMGAVYEGENIRIHRKVAIKVLHSTVAEKKDVVVRFEREAQAAGRIGSAHIVEVLDLGELPDGSRFMVMEFMDGTPLDQRIRDMGRLAPEEAVPIVTQLLEGLASAHAAGIIHRDLKPANIFLLKTKGGQKDFLKILDFGVSKFNVLSGDGEMSMTRTGSVVGTPFYMSPEQAKGSKSVDGRSDLYAVGVILYECITGQVPFHAETFNELIFKIVLETPPPAESFVPDLDTVFAGILRRSMSREVTERYQTAEEFKKVLEIWLEEKDRPGIPVGPGQTAVLLAGGGTAVLPPGATARLAGAGAPAPYTQTSLLDRPPPSHASAPIAQQMAQPHTAQGPVAMAPAQMPQGGHPSYPEFPEESIRLPTKSGAPVIAIVLGALLFVGLGGTAAYMFAGGEGDATANVGAEDEGRDDETEDEDEDDSEDDAEDDAEGDSDSDAEEPDSDAEEPDSDAEEPDSDAEEPDSDAEEPDDLDGSSSDTPASPPVAVAQPPTPPPPGRPPPQGGGTKPKPKPKPKPPPGRTISADL